MSVGVERGSGTDNRMHRVAQGVVHCKVYHQIMETAFGRTQVLSVNALHSVWRIVNAAHGTAAEMSVGVERGSSADNGMDSVAQCIVHRKVYHQITITAVGRTQILSVNTLHSVWRIVNTAHGTAAEMSVSVERGSGTDYGMYGVAQGIRYGDIDGYQIAVGQLSNSLIINTLQIIQSIVVDIHRTGTDSSVDIYVCGIQHVKGYHQIAQTTVGGTISLAVNTCLRIACTISIETLAFADSSSHRVSKSVFHP